MCKTRFDSQGMVLHGKPHFEFPFFRPFHRLYSLEGVIAKHTLFRNILSPEKHLSLHLQWFADEWLGFEKKQLACIYEILEPQSQDVRKIDSGFFGIF